MIEQSLEVDAEAWSPPADSDTWDGTESMKQQYFEMVKSLASVPE